MPKIEDIEVKPKKSEQRYQICKMHVFHFRHFRAQILAAPLQYSFRPKIQLCKFHTLHALFKLMHRIHKQRCRADDYDTLLAHKHIRFAVLTFDSGQSSIQNEIISITKH